MKKNFTYFKYKLSFVLLLFLVTNSLKAQLTVIDPTNASAAYDPITLISNVFIAGGVQIDTIIYQGDLQQVGYFQNAGALGLSEGIILSSGGAEEAPNLASGATTPAGGVSGGPATSPYLSGLIPGFPLNDIVQYEITFTPTTSNLSFQYVFASEEYPTYAPPNVSNFNDVFGFFISGPNNTLPYSNIATIPGATTPVSIFNINAVTNSTLYNANIPNVNVKYGGYTTVMTASANVIPCQQYTIILSICDAGDSAFDSAIFLEGGSFTTNGIIATPVSPSPDTVLAEGCSSGSMDFLVSSPTAVPIPITYSVGGTATMGVDYDSIPASGIIPIGGTSFSLPIVPLEDGVADGQEYIEFIFNTNPCTVDTVRIYIKDNDLTASISDTFICVGDSVTLDATSPIAIPPPYTFTDYDTVATIEYQQVQSTMNISGFPFPLVSAGMIESICLDITHPNPADLDIFLIAPDGKFLELSTDNGQLLTNFGSMCFVPSGAPTIFGASSPFSGNYVPEGFWNFLYGAPVNGTWTLQVTDDDFYFDGTINGWSINFAPIYDIQYGWTPGTNISSTTNPIVTVTPPVTTDYIVSLTDTYGCTVTDTSTIFVDDQLPAPIITCGNITNSSIEFVWSAIPNAASYQVNINGTGWIPANGVLAHTVTGLASGTSATIEVQAVQSAASPCTLPPLIGSHSCITSTCALSTNIASQTDASCFGGSDGTVTIAIPSGVAPYLLSINNGIQQANTTFTGLPAGNHTIVITDSVNCQETQVVTIGEPTQVGGEFTVTNVSCNSGNDGTATVLPSGGANTTYTYSWSTTPAQTTQTATGLSAGTYMVIVTDTNNCVNIIDTTIIEPTALAITMDSIAALCNAGASGMAMVTTTGGTAPYSYAWSHDAMLNNDTATALVAGNYTVTVTDANNCTITGTIQVVEPSAISSSTTTTDATCNSSGDGTATVTATNGTPGYIYLWDVNANSQTTAIATGLNQGTYTVTITDANSCTVTETATVNVPSPIVLSMASTNLSCYGSSDGTATVTATGGAGTYNYAWNTTPTQTTQTATGLSAGTSIVTVTDVNGCFDTAHVFMTGQVVMTIGFTDTDVNCNGGNDGTSTVNITNGNSPFTYTWDNGQSGQTTTALTIGTYAVTIVDNIGCIGIDSTTIGEPTALQSSTVTTPLDCYGDGTGTATVTVMDGTAGYTYAWDVNAGSQTTAAATALQAGTYYVTTTDANNCTIIDTAIITQPDSLTLTMSNTAVSCNGAADGTASVAAIGGTGIYTYLWDAAAGNQTTATATALNGGTYTVTVTDANGCFKTEIVSVYEPPLITYTTSSTNITCFGGNDATITITNTTMGGTPIQYSIDGGTTYQATGVFTNLAAGTYIPVCNLLNGTCAITGTAITITEPDSIALAFTTTPTLCNGGNDGTATVIVTNGFPIFTYLWNNGETNATANTLTAGTAIVTVTDGSGCIMTDSTIITEPTVLVTTTDSIRLLCFEDGTGSAIVNASGGVGTYTYLWDAVAGSQTTDTASNLMAGTYYVTVTDNNNCLIVDSVIVTQPMPLILTSGANSVSCNGGNNGLAYVTASGGTSPYFYSWNDGGNQVTDTAFSLLSSDYLVAVTDVNGCTPTDSIFVPQPTALAISMSMTPVSCFGGNDGTTTVNTLGGVAPYNFAWNTTPVQTDSTALGLTTGWYIVTVTDANNCDITDSIFVTEPTQIITSVTGTDASCFGVSDGTATVTVSGGVSGYTFAWDGVSVGATPTVSNLSSGWHYLVVTDTTGCTAMDSININEPGAIVLSTSMTSVSCSGGTDGTATVTPSGGAGGFSYQWSTSPSQFTATATGLTTGSYTVTVTDMNGCFTTSSILVTTPNPLISTLTGTNVDCFGAATGTITTATTGGVPNYTYAWSSGETTANLIQITAGNYTVTITDNNGCNIIENITITQPTAPIVIATTGTEVSCHGGSNGTATATVTGGTAPYFYSWNTIPQQVTATATNLSAGTYTLTVTDANGCTQIQMHTIQQPSNITAIITEEGSSCFGASDGTATVTASGGTPGYTYLWNTIPQQVGATATNLTGGGNYTVTITDTLGCTLSQNITITQPTAVTVTTTQTNITCNGFTDGTATALPLGGTPNYTFLWDANANNQTTATATGLGIGTYAVTVTDTNGCTASISMTIIEPNPLFIHKDGTDVLCKGDNTGTATATFSGGNAPYSPVWSFNNATTNNINNLPAGTYYLTITDASNCQLTDSVIVDEPAEILELSAETIDNLCYNDRDGEIKVSGTGGTYPYTYSLDDENYSNSNRFVGLLAGDYVVYTQDDNGCKYSDSVTIIAPAEFTIDAIADLDIDFGDAAVLDVTATNGIAPIIYVWTPAENLSCDSCMSPVADSLASDTYFEVFAIDANGCEAESSMYVRVATPRYVFIANGFTPNDDGNNDVLYVQGGRGTTQVKSFQVFDRWGELVYNVENAPLNDINFGWDGTYKGEEMNSGMFVWSVEVEFEDGKVVTYKGSTFLIR